MEQTGIKVQNLREVNRALKAIGVPAAEVRKAGLESGQSVMNEAKALVPVKTGRLRNSIRLGATGRGRITVRAGNNTRVPYANPIHWGWFRRNIKPQPFFIKALGLTRQEVFDNYFKALNKLIAEETAKTKIG